MKDGSNNKDSADIICTCCNTKFEDLRHLYIKVFLKLIQVKNSEHYKLSKYSCHISFTFRDLELVSEQKYLLPLINQYFHDATLPCIMRTYYSGKTSKYMGFASADLYYLENHYCPKLLKHFIDHPNATIQVEVRFLATSMIICDIPFAEYLNGLVEENVCRPIVRAMQSTVDTISSEGLVLGTRKLPKNCFRHRPSIDMPKYEFPKLVEENPYIKLERRKKFAEQYKGQKEEIHCYIQ